MRDRNKFNKYCEVINSAGGPFSFANTGWSGGIYTSSNNSNSNPASIQFFGTGARDSDRIKIPVNSSEPANIGATDFTIEVWLRPELPNSGTTPETNTGPAITPGENIDWILGNIFYDRDRFSNERAHGMSLTDGRVTFGLRG